MSDNYGFSLLKALADNVSRFSNYSPNCSSPNQKLKTSIVYTDQPSTESAYSLITDEIKSVLTHDLFDFDVLPLCNYTYQRCIACNACPPKLVRESSDYLSDNYGCIFQSETDDLRLIHSRLLGSSIIFILANSSENNLFNRYQSFLERTRYLRRDDFMWTNKIIIPVVSVHSAEFHHSVLPVKIMSAFMRHNSVITSPISVLYNDEEVLCSSFSSFDVTSLLNLSSFLQTGHASLVASYKSLGYSDKSLDYTNAFRS